MTNLPLQSTTVSVKKLLYKNKLLHSFSHRPHRPSVNAYTTQPRPKNWDNGWFYDSREIQTTLTAGKSISYTKRANGRVLLPVPSFKSKLLIKPSFITKHSQKTTCKKTRTSDNSLSARETSVVITLH